MVVLEVVNEKGDDEEEDKREHDEGSCSDSFDFPFENERKDEHCD